MNRPITPLFFGEKAFGVFFFLWGVILILDRFTNAAAHGIFYGYLKSYFSPCIWGSIFILISALRWAAYKYQLTAWRKRLSLLTFISMVIVASISVYTRLWAATAPLTIFVAYVAYWSHKSLLRDLRP